MSRPDYEQLNLIRNRVWARLEAKMVEAGFEVASKSVYAAAFSHPSISNWSYPVGVILKAAGLSDMKVAVQWGQRGYKKRPHWTLKYSDDILDTVVLAAKENLKLNVEGAARREADADRRTKLEEALAVALEGAPELPEGFSFGIADLQNGTYRLDVGWSNYFRGKPMNTDTARKIAVALAGLKALLENQ